MEQKIVERFCVQPTRSFEDGAPQREEFDSDESHLVACVKYGAEWRKEYKHEGICKDYACPQCQGGHVVLERERARAVRMGIDPDAPAGLEPS